MKKLSLPRARDGATARWIEAVTDTLETITGRRGKIERLPSDATLEDVIAKVNEIIDRLQ